MSLLAARRPARLLSYATVALMATAAACGGDKKTDVTAPGNSVAGTYAVATINGNQKPSELSGSFVIQTGNSWRMTLTDDTGTITDNGTYTGNAGSLRFKSTKFGDEFDGSLTDGNQRLSVTYDIGGGRVFTFGFRR